PGGEVRNRNADPHRSLPRQAGDRHQPAHPLRDLIDARTLGVGAILSEARDAAIDDTRIDLRYRRVVDAEPVLHVGTVVLDHHIGGPGEIEEQRLTLLALE